MISVVAAIIVRPSAPRRILLTQRLASKDFPLTWECPGGKVEENETPWQGLRRELVEELGIEILRVSDGPIWTGEFSNPVERDDRNNIVLSFWRVLEFTGSPRPLEGQGVGWFSANEMRALNLAPGNLRAEKDVIISAFGP